jgi:RNA polymerase sigma factor (sigma-70 family)
MRFETMPTSPLKLVIQQLRTASERDGAGKTDGELLTRFLSHRDNDALAALVHRHAPMVWGVCRRLLRSPHDAEDALQATFLVLVRKAATVLPREMVGNWLYGVAHQTAVRLRATAAKRGVREMQMMEMPEPVVAEARSDDLLLLLDQELSCLPEKYRVVIVLCDLESRTRIEVARQLAIPEGTVASRLARARGMLAKRLARHGLAVSGGSLAATLSQTVASASVLPSVVSSTIKAAAAFAAGQGAAGAVISVKVAALTEGVLKVMLLTKLKIVAVVMVVAWARTGGGVMLMAVGQAEGQPEAKKAEVPKKADEPKAEKAKGDKEQIQGTWKVVKEEVNGAESADSEELKKKCKWVITGDKITIEFDGQNAEFTYSLDLKKTPKTIDLKNVGGEKMEGIYSLQGDELKICTALVGKERPQEFDTKSGEATLLVLKRAK